MKNNILFCEFNIDTACVEVKLADGLMIAMTEILSKTNMQTIYKRYRNLVCSSTINQKSFYYNIVRFLKLCYTISA